MKVKTQRSKIVLRSLTPFVLFFSALLFFSCAADTSANQAIHDGTNCNEECPVGAQKASVKEADGICKQDGTYVGAVAGVSQGQCVGSGECQVICLYPECPAGSTLEITADAFRCIAGNNDPCAEVDCSGHGRCRNNNGQAQCVCDAGYYDDGVECIPDVCYGIDCSNHGDCVEQSGAPACDCDEGYFEDGLECLPEDIEVDGDEPNEDGDEPIEDGDEEAEADPCEDISCGDNAYCLEGACHCEEGYEGDPDEGCTPIVIEDGDEEIIDTLEEDDFVEEDTFEDEVIDTIEDEVTDDAEEDLMDEEITDTSEQETSSCVAPDITWSISDRRTGQELYDAIAIAPDNIYAVGKDGSVMHYDGESWAAETLGVGYSDFKAICGNNDSELWAMGTGNPFHFIGGEWVEETETGLPSTVNACWASPTRKTFAATTDGIWIYDENVWTKSTTAQVAESYLGITGTDDTSVVAIRVSKVIRYDGTEWRSIGFPPSATLYDIYLESLDDFWISGTFSNVHHYDGFDYISHNDAFPSSQDLNRIDGACENEVYVLSTRNNAKKVWQFNGESWRLIYDEEHEEAAIFHDILVTESGDVWLFGKDTNISNNSLIIHGVKASRSSY